MKLDKVSEILKEFGFSQIYTTAHSFATYRKEKIRATVRCNMLRYPSKCTRIFIGVNESGITTIEDIGLKTFVPVTRVSYEREHILEMTDQTTPEEIGAFLATAV